MYLISFYSAVSYHQIKVDLHFIAKTLQGILIIKKKMLHVCPKYSLSHNELFPYFI